MGMKILDNSEMAYTGVGLGRFDCSGTLYTCIKDKTGGSFQ